MRMERRGSSRATEAAAVERKLRRLFETLDSLNEEPGLVSRSDARDDQLGRLGGEAGRPVRLAGQPDQIGIPVRVVRGKVSELAGDSVDDRGRHPD